MQTMTSVRQGSWIATLALLVGCVSAGGGFDQLPADEQAMFRRCTPRVSELLCGRAADGARCMEKQEATFAARRSSKLRRNWLALNECPASVLDAPEAPAVATAAPTPATAAVTPPVSTPADPEAQPEPEPPAPDLPEKLPTAKVPVVAEVATPVALLPVGAACKRSSECDSDLCVRSACASLAALEVGKACVTSPAPELVAKAPAPPALAKDATPTRLATDRAAPEQLREAIVEHEAEMKKCVERQLKLVPDLRAEGTLVLEVNAAGKVTQAALRGEQLQGTPLEGCVRAIAARWIFPRTSRAYAVEAPLKVSGINERRN
jgi:hypothetical protein